MWRVFLLLPFLLLLGAKPVPVSHLLGWDYAAPAAGWIMEQCVQTGQRCPMRDLAAMDGTTRTLEVMGLEHNKRYCWRVRLSDTGQSSNLVCSG
jgi:hypothetical protein